MSNVISLKGTRELPKNAPRSVRSTTEAVILATDAVKAWQAPPFQRPLRVNEKVMALAEELRCNGGILPGILTIGVLNREKFLVDGQHRIEGFKLSELAEVYAEIRICHFDSMADMAHEFGLLNGKIVNMRPDDILRGLEYTNEGLALIRKHCDFVGYDMIRRGKSAPVVSMSAILRCWFSSAKEVPAGPGGGAQALAKLVTHEEAQAIAQFLNTAFGAWGRDPEYFRLWGGLNVTMTMWLWRRTVMSQYSQKSVRLTAQQFGKCLMSMSAQTDYLDWLVSRMMSDRDRSPCYQRIKTIFSKRIEADGGKKPMFPLPAWHHARG